MFSATSRQFASALSATGYEPGVVGLRRLCTSLFAANSPFIPPSESSPAATVHHSQHSLSTLRVRQGIAFTPTQLYNYMFRPWGSQWLLELFSDFRRYARWGASAELRHLSLYRPCGDPSRWPPRQGTLCVPSNHRTASRLTSQEASRSSDVPQSRWRTFAVPKGRSR